VREDIGRRDVNVRGLMAGAQLDAAGNVVGEYTPASVRAAKMQYDAAKEIAALQDVGATTRAFGGYDANENMARMRAGVDAMGNRLRNAATMAGYGFGVDDEGNPTQSIVPTQERVMNRRLALDEQVAADAAELARLQAGKPTPLDPALAAMFGQQAITEANRVTGLTPLAEEVNAEVGTPGLSDFFMRGARRGGGPLAFTDWARRRRSRDRLKELAAEGQDVSGLKVNAKGEVVVRPGAFDANRLMNLASGWRLGEAGAGEQPTTYDPNTGKPAGRAGPTAARIKKAMEEAAAREAAAAAAGPILESEDEAAFPMY